MDNFLVIVSLTVVVMVTALLFSNFLWLTNWNCWHLLIFVRLKFNYVLSDCLMAPRGAMEEEELLWLPSGPAESL